MATILQFPIKKAVPVWGLTEQECDTVQTEAYDLMLRGQATGVSIHNDGQYMCVFDGNGQPYAIGREDSVFYLSDPEEKMIAYSRQFQDVLQALEVLLTSRTDGAV
jgi:hypothetical protein